MCAQHVWGQNAFEQASWMFAPPMVVAFLCAWLLSGCDSDKQEPHPAPQADSVSESEAEAKSEPEAKPEPEAPPPPPDVGGPKSIRLLLGGKPGKQIAAFLGEIDHGTSNLSCKEEPSETLCGQVIGAEGIAQNLAGEGEDPEIEVRLIEAIIEPETNKGKKMLRVRVQGYAAAAIAKVISPERATPQDGADVMLNGKNHTCIIAADGKHTCGFILDEAGKTLDLETFGYD